MKILFQVALSSILLFLTGCSSSVPYSFFSNDDVKVTIPSTPVLDIDSSEVTRLIQDYTVGLKYDQEINLEHAKVYFNEGIHTIQLEFVSQRIVEICDARMLIVDVVEGLLPRLNMDPGLASQYSTYPFPYENLEIYITFESYYGRYIDPYYIQWLSLEDGEVTYYAWDVYDNTKACWHARHEPYKNAREIAISQRVAEENYEDAHAPDHSVFGNTRYFPKD